MVNRPPRWSLLGILVLGVLLISTQAHADLNSTTCSWPNCKTSSGIPIVTFGSLPAASSVPVGTQYVVTNSDGTACNGTGSVSIVCISNGTTWGLNPGGASAGVASFGGRTGAVVPGASDYPSSLIGYNPTTSTDWSAWTTAPTTTLSAFDKIATAIRALFAVWSYDRVVDAANGIVWNGFSPTTYPNFCAAASQSIQPWATNTTTVNVPFRVKWVGAATVTQASGQAYLASEYTICVPMVPSAAYTGNFPTMTVAALTGKKLFIDWDGLNVAFDATGQTRPFVMFQMGNLYGVGWDNAAADGSTDTAASNGYVGNGILTSGSMTVRRLNGLSTGWVQGVPVQLPFAATNTAMSQTSFIAFFDNNLLRSDMANSTVTCNGVGTDYDDVCWVHEYGWDNSFPRIISNGFAVGIMISGNTGDEFPGGWIESAQIGFLAGGPLNTYSVAVSTNCLNTLTKCTRRLNPTGGFHLKNFTIEGNTFGNIVLSDAYIGATVEDTWTEMAGTESGDGVLLGAGWCRDTGTPTNSKMTPCSLDSQCTTRLHGTACQDTALYSAANAYGNGSVGAYFTDITFVGGMTGGDKGNVNASGLAFGPGFRQISTQGTTRAMFVGTETVWNTDGGAHTNQLFEAHANATGVIDFSNAHYDTAFVKFSEWYPGLVYYSGSIAGCQFNLENPTTAVDGFMQCKLDYGGTLRKVSCSTTGNSIPVNLYSRAVTSANTGTTNLLTADLTCNSDTTEDATSTFSTSVIPVGNYLALGIHAGGTTTSTDWVRVFVLYQVFK